MVRRAARATLDEALDGLERIGGGVSSERRGSVGGSHRPPSDALVGMGRSGSSAGAAPARAWLPARDRGRRGAPAPAGGARTGAPRRSGAVRVDDARRCARSSARRASATITPSGSCTPPARAIPTSCGCGPARPRARPTRWSGRATASSCAPCSIAVRSASVAVVPFGGGTSVVGGVAPLRGGHAAVIALDMGGMARVLELDRELADGHRTGRHPRARRWSAELAAERLHARSLPAVLRVRLARRLRGDALGGTGLDAATAAIEQDGARPAPRGAGRRDRSCARCPPAPPGRAAPAAGRLGGDARGDHRADAARAPRAALSASTRACSSRTSPPALQALRELAQRARAARRRAPVRRGRDADVAGAGRRRRGQGAARAGLCRPARLRRGLPGDPRLRGRGARRSPPGASARWSCARRAAALAVGRRPGEAWARGASRRRICATSCSTHGRDGRDARDRGPVVEPAGLHRAVAAAIADALAAEGTPGLVMCHVSHLYETGASLYFTFLARQREGDRARAVGRGQARGEPRRSSRAAARSPTTTRSGATTRRGWRTRSGARASTRCAR